MIRRSTIIWFMVSATLVFLIGMEVVWAINTLSPSSQKFRQEVLEQQVALPAGSRSGPELMLSPPLMRVDTDQLFDVDIILQPNNQPVVGADIVLTYDPEILSVEDGIATRSGTQIIPRGVELVAVRNTVDNKAGTITFSTTPQPGRTITRRTVLGSILFRAVDNGTSKVIFQDLPNSTTDTNIVGLEGEVLDRTLGAQYVVGRDDNQL